LVKRYPVAALFGGSFDPPHRGHQAIAAKVSAMQDIDCLVIMPTYLNPLKASSLAPAEKRLEWCRMVCRGKKIRVSDFEVSSGRPVYTIETLRMLETHYEVKYLVIGADNLHDIEAWRSFDEINSKVIWLVFGRGDTEMPQHHPLKHYRYLTLNIPSSSSAIRNGDSLDAVDRRILNEVKAYIQIEGKK